MLDDASGEPVAGADARLVAAGEHGDGTVWRSRTLDLTDADGATVPEKAVVVATTGPDGRCALPGAPLRRPHTAVVRLAGFAPGFATVVPVSGQPVDVVVRLRRAARLECRVVDAEGRAVAGAAVRAEPAAAAGALSLRRDEALGIADRTRPTDDRGIVVFDDLDADGVYDVSAVHAGHRVAVPLCRPSAAPAKPVELRLPATGRLALRFAPTESPVRPDEVWLTCLDCRRTVRPSKDTLSGAPLEVAAGRWRVEARTTYERPAGAVEVVVVAGETTSAEVRWNAATPLLVHVSDWHGGACACSLYVDLWTDEEDEPPYAGEGREGVHTASFGGVWPGRWVVRVSNFDSVTARDLSVERRVVTTPCDPVSIVLAPPPVVVIRHNASRGPWRAEILVPGGPAGTFAAKRWDTEWSDSSDAATELTTGPGSALPAGPARVRVFVPGCVPWTADVVLESDRETIVYADSLVPGVALTGRVLDGGGSPVGDAQIRVVAAPPGDVACDSEEDGSFGPLTVSPGRAVLEVRAAGYATRRAVASARVGGPPVEIRMSRGGAVEVVVTDGSGVSIPGVAVRASAGDAEPAGPDRSAQTDHRGRATFVLAPGRWSLGADGVETTDMDVADGVVQTVRLCRR